MAKEPTNPHLIRAIKDTLEQRGTVPGIIYTMRIPLGKKFIINQDRLGYYPELVDDLPESEHIVFSKYSSDD